MAYEVIYVCNSTNNKNVRRGELNILEKHEEQLYFEFGPNEMNIKKRFYNDIETLNKDFNNLLKLKEKEEKEKEKQEQEEGQKEEKETETLNLVKEINGNIVKAYKELEEAIKEEPEKIVKKEAEKDMKKTSKEEKAGKYKIIKRKK